MRRVERSDRSREETDVADAVSFPVADGVGKIEMKGVATRSEPKVAIKIGVVVADADFEEV